jgi:NitT/TauT family transport system permease protein
LLGLWQLAINVFNPPPYIIPSPTALGLALWSAATDINLWINISVTAEEVAIAFVVAAFLAGAMGLWVTESRIAERIILPYVIAIQAVPKVAIAPLIIIWFGFGIGSKIVIAAMLAFFPIFVNVVTGFKAIDQRQMMLMRSLCASRWQIFFKLRLMTACPYIFAGLQIAAVLASLGAIVGEFVGAKQGIGSMIIRSQTEMDVANVFVGVVALSLMVSVLHAAVKIVSKKVVFWTEFEEKTEA